ncbi:MAG: hypothetical protein AAGA48_03215 [Myxococcota bacterium]
MRSTSRPRSSLGWWLWTALFWVGFFTVGCNEAPAPVKAEVPAARVGPPRGACLDAAPSPGHAQNLDSLPLPELLVRLQKPHFVTPPEAPTEVGIALQVFEIAEIDPATNTFEMEGYLDLVWCDPREGFDPAVVGTDREIFLENDAERELDFIWWPDFYFVNEVGPRRTENRELILKPNGTVEYREKFGVRLAANYDMRRFPFDQQTLEVEIESFAWSTEDLRFVLQDQIITFTDDFEIPEWSIIDVEESIKQKTEPRDQHEYSELLAEIEVRRDPGFYVTKIMLPLGIIVAISWAVFWMIGDTLADRMSVSFTGVLTSVAYQFIVSESLPRHIYDTFLDGFVLLSFLMMVFTIMENIVVNSLSLGGRDQVATRVDQASRVLFPTLYVGSLTWLYFVYLSPPS